MERNHTDVERGGGIRQSAWENGFIRHRRHRCLRRRALRVYRHYVRSVARQRSSHGYSRK